MIDRELHNLRRETERLRRLLDQLGNLSLQITSTLELPVVLQVVVDSACDLTDAKYGALGVFDEHGHIVEFITHGITPVQRDRIGDLPRGLGILGWIQELQQPLRMADLTGHPRSVGFPANHPPMKTFLGAPLRHQNEKLGNLYLTEKNGGSEFTQEDESLLVLFAAQAAAAIHNARLHQMVAAERGRVGALANERGKLLEMAEQERRRLGVLVDTSPVGVFVAEAGSGQVLLVNPEAQRIMGFAHRPEYGMQVYEKAAVYRRAYGSAYLPEELPLQRALNQGESVRAEEIRFEFPDGRSVLTLVNATPIYSDSGSVTAAIAVIQDISPLEEMEKLRNEFLGMVSHELRTPLTAIKGSAATVLGSRRPVDAAESREFFQIIDEQADRLRDMVDNLLDLTRIEAGSLSVATTPASLPEIIQEACDTVVRNGARQEVRLRIPDDLPQVNADQRRVGQVLVNLLGNAVKFSPAAAPIDIEATHDQVHVTVQVRDQGRGVSREMLPHLFKKFSQIHEDSGSRLAGSGLGLAICKGIVEAHGGRIWAESPGPGEGTTFRFTLPRAMAAAGASIVTNQRAQHLGRVHRAGERTKILAVDDEQRVLRYLERTLDDAGYSVLTAGDPNQVTRLVELEEPDLLLLDLMMPGLDGLDLLQQVREFSGVPVIFVTGRNRDEDTVKALRMGADDFITKPFSPSELLARIEATLRRRVLSDQIEVRPAYVLDDLTINFAHRQVMIKDRPVSLSATEYKILYELASHAGMVLTHGQILQRVWGPEYSGENDLVRSFIRNVRRKLGDEARNPRYIFTEPQVGYRMARP